MTKSLSKNIIFEVTQRCNCNCKYCYNVWKNNGSYPKGELSTWKIKRLLKKVIKESQPNLITLTGGEPLLRNDLEEVIEFLSKRGIEVNIITNGILLKEKRIEELVGSGISIFELPLLSHKREVHNQLMRMHSFDLITAAIVRIKKYRAKVITVFVATKENIGDFENTARLSFALGANGMMFNRFNPGGEGAKYIKELLPSSQEILETLRIAEKFSEQYNFSISCSIPIQPCIVDTSEFKRIGFGFCSAGTEKAYYTIDSLGNLRMCNHSKIILGNLFKKSFQNLISMEIANNFISAIPSSCGQCKIKNTCLGGCKAAAEVCFGSIEAEDPFLSINRKEKLLVLS